VSSSGAANEATVTTMIGAVEDDDLWCTHCMDDPAVAVCAFCGCRVSDNVFHLFIFILLCCVTHSSSQRILLERCLLNLIWRLWKLFLLHLSMLRGC
jgi:predicted acyltransferase